MIACDWENDDGDDHVADEYAGPTNFCTHLGQCETKFTSLKTIKEWTPESPYLYTVVLELVDTKTKRVMDVESCRVGFRDVVLKQGQLLLNGVRSSSNKTTRIRILNSRFVLEHRYQQ